MESFLNGKLSSHRSDFDRRKAAPDLLKARVSVIDPCLFTLPCDEALVSALLAAGLRGAGAAPAGVVVLV